MSLKTLSSLSRPIHLIGLASRVEDWIKLWLPELNPTQRRLLINKLMETIGDNIDTQSLVNQSRREEAKQAFAVNKRLEGIREKITGKPEVIKKEWWK